MNVKNILVEMRVYEWYKNLLVFIPLFFSGNLFNSRLLFISLLSFFAMCFASSAIYIINDIVDVKRDKKDKEKKKRPLASGILSLKFCTTLAVALVLLAGLLILKFTNLLTFFLLGVFLLNSLLYSKYFRNLFVVDSISISINHILRAIIGCTSINVRVSPWLVAFIFFSSLLLVYFKRRSEILKGKTKNRPILIKYSALVDDFIRWNVSIVLVLLSLYLIFNREYLVYSLPFFTIVVFRYFSFLKNSKNYNPMKFLYTDKVSLTAFLLFIFLLFLGIYVIR